MSLGNSDVEQLFSINMILLHLCCSTKEPFLFRTCRYSHVILRNYYEGLSWGGCPRGLFNGRGIQGGDKGGHFGVLLWGMCFSGLGVKVFRGVIRGWFNKLLFLLWGGAIIGGLLWWFIWEGYSVGDYSGV